MIRQQSPMSMSQIKCLITMCLLVIDTGKSTHSLHQDVFASTNRIHCRMSCMTLQWPGLHFLSVSLHRLWNQMSDGVNCQKCMIPISMCLQLPWQYVFCYLSVYCIWLMLIYVYIYWSLYRAAVWKDRVWCWRTITTLHPTTPLKWRKLGENICFNFIHNCPNVFSVMVWTNL